MAQGNAGYELEFEDTFDGDVLDEARGLHVYAAEWTPERMAFFVDHRLVKTVEQSPAYPMQFMLGIHEFPEDGPSAARPHPYPKQFAVDYVGGYRPSTSRPA